MMNGSDFSTLLMSSQSLRSVHASSSERFLLLSVISNHLLDLENKDTDSKTLNRRNAVWADITKIFNEKTHGNRNRSQVQTLYKNMKAKAKKYQIRLVESKSDCSMAPERDEVSEMLLAMLNAEQSRRRSLIQKAAVMAISETMPHSQARRNFENLITKESDSHDVSKFLRHELIEDQEHAEGNGLEEETKGNEQLPDYPCYKQEMDGTNQNLVRGGLNGDYEASSDSLPNILKNDVNSPTTEGTAIISDQENTNINENPSDVLLRHMKIAQPSCSFDSDESDEPSTKRFKLDDAVPSDPMNNSLNPSAIVQLVKDWTAMQNLNSKSHILRGHLLEDQVSPSTSCCSIFHNQVLLMKQTEHHLKVSLLKEQVKGVEQENRFRDIENQLKLEILKRKLENVKNNSKEQS